MLTAIFPIWARIALIVGALAIIFGIGYVHGRDNEAEKKDLEIATLQHAFDERVKAADDALIAANSKTRATEQAAADRMGQLSKTYQQEIADENARHARAVADLRSGATRLRVSITPIPANTCGGGGLPQAPAAAAGSNAAATAELAPDVAARLAARDVAYETVARELQRCQQVVDEDRKIINGAQATPPAVTPAVDPVKSRSRFKLGAPNPFDK